MAKSKEMLAAIWIILLLLSFLYFSPSFEGASEKLEKISQMIRLVTVRHIPDIVTIKVKVLRADMSISANFTGNETNYELKPVKGALIVVGKHMPIVTPHIIRIPQSCGFTGNDGVVILRVPKGNTTLMIAENARYHTPPDFWKTSITVDENKTFIVKIFLYRLKPTKITVHGNPFKLKTPITLSFNLPAAGRYYVGYLSVSYYDIWRNLRFYREDLNSSIILSNPDQAYNMIRMSYSIEYPGGMPMDKSLEVDGPTAYVIPSSSYLPVERIILEEETS